MNKQLSLIFLILNFYLLKAQMPDTDIWLFKVEKIKTDPNALRLKLSTPKNITNRKGYDNQPCFSEDGKKIYYTSVREDNQADIYCYDFGSQKTAQITKTKESEYSPTPSIDNKFLNSVVVENDSAQRIHFINPLTGISERKIDIDSVGYFTFLNYDTVLYYKLTQPHSLRYYSKTTNNDEWLGNNPIRAFKTINRSQFIYGIKDSSKVIFYKYDFVLHKAEKYAEFASVNEDIIWHIQYGLIKSEGNKLLRYDEKNKEWNLLFDLTEFGIKKITRFNFDPKNNYLVVVDNL